MTTSRYRIVIALDLTEYSTIVLEHALDQARSHGPAELHFVTVVGERADIVNAQRALAGLVLPALEEVRDLDWTSRLHVRQGKAARELADLAAETRAHVLVLGRFGTHHPHRRIGKTASEVIELAPCAALVVGLVDQTASAEVQCPACVVERESSEGRRWFCAAHSAPDRIRLSAFVPSGASLSGGGLLW